MKFLFWTALTSAVFAQALEWKAHYRMTGAEYQQTFDHYVSLGYVLNSVSGYERDGVANYAAIFEKTNRGEPPVHVSGYELNGAPRFAALYELITDNNLGWWSWAHQTGSQLQEKFDEYLEDGYRLTDQAGYSVGGKTFFNGIWDNSTAKAWWAQFGMDSPTFQSQFNKYKADGYVLTTLNGYPTSSGDRYAAIWVRS
ncbi:hypothetical protein BJY04DRAFT_212414 [Aspergillus karnatakaensis]|uniref:uncharacterized protein n=1 Tax=Aspergillus karnatakaensis TaxID=1810916 RepID=UPI003CCCDE9B